MADILANKFTQFGQNAPYVQEFTQLSQKQQIFISRPNLLFCMYVRQIRTHHDMDVVRTANEGYWQNFGRFHAFLVSFPTRVFSGGHVFGFEKIEFFRRETTFVFRTS